MAGSSATVTIDERTPLISPSISPRTIPYEGEDDVEAIPSQDEDSLRKDDVPIGTSPIVIVLILTVGKAETISTRASCPLSYGYVSRFK